LRHRSILVILVLAVVGAGIVIVFLTRPQSPGEGGPASDDLDRRLERLRSVPYTSVTGEKVGTDSSGVVLFDRERAYRGYNLFCPRVTPEVILMDMDGRVVNRWTFPTDQEDISEYAILLENGDVLVIVKFKYLMRLDWHSRPIWQRKMVLHHDVAVTPDSTLYTISLAGEAHRGLVVRFPVIIHLDSGGKEIDRWSAYEHMDEIKQKFDQRSFLDTILDSMLEHMSWLEIHEKITERGEAILLLDSKIQYDHFHLNTITVLPDTPLGRRDRRFREGNLLICFRNVNQIAILDGDTREILWVWGEGVLEWPHHPTMLDNGNMLVFDNGAFRKYSRVVELDPVSGSVVWQYTGDPPASFYSYGKGSAQRLPNGNTLICEGDKGRAFEVTQQGEIVWQWLNPMTRDGRRVQIYRMMRLSPAIVEPLLNLPPETWGSELKSEPLQSH
jgi:hypothetical protein